MTSLTVDMAAWGNSSLGETTASLGGIVFTPLAAAYTISLVDDLNIAAGSGIVLIPGLVSNETFSGGSMNIGTGATASTVNFINNGTGTLGISSGITDGANASNAICFYGPGPISVTGVISGLSGGLSKNGMGTLILGGNNNIYSGPTTVNGGTMELDYSANNNSKIAGGAALFLNGGAVQLNGGGGFTQNVSSTTIGGVAGQNAILRSGGGSNSISLGMITFINGATNFGANDVASTTAGAGNGSNGLLGGLAACTVAGADWAYNNNGEIEALPVAGYNQTLPGSGGGGSNTTDYLETGGYSTSLLSNLTFGTLKVAPGSGQSMNLNGHSLDLGNGAAGTAGLLFTGTNAYTITGSRIETSGSGAGAGDVILQDWGSGVLTLNAALYNTTDKYGTGKVILGVNAAAAPNLNIYAGTIQYSSDSQLGSTSTNTITLNGGFGTGTALIASSSSQIDTYRNIVLGTQGGNYIEDTGYYMIVGSSTTYISGGTGNPAINAITFGGASAVDSKNNTAAAASVLLAGPNTYTGGSTFAGSNAQALIAQNGVTSGPFGAGMGTLTFAGGVLQFSSKNGYDYSNRFSTAANQPFNIDLNGEGVTFAIGLAGAGSSLTLYSSTKASTLTLTGSSTYTGQTTINSSATLQLGDGTIGHDATIASTSGVTDNGTLTYNRFGSSTEPYPIGGSGGVAFIGTGSETLSGSNSFTGATNVNGGTLIISGSLGGTAAISANSGAILEVDGSANTAATINCINATIQGVGRMGALLMTSTSSVAPGLTAASGVTGGASLTGGSVTFLDTASTLSVGLGISTGSDSTMLASSGTVILNNTPLQLTIGSALNNSANIGRTYIIINGGAGATGTGSNAFTYNGTILEGGSAAGRTFTTSSGYEFTVIYGSNGSGGAGNDVVLLLDAVPRSPVSYYVSPGGNDSNSGTSSSSPWASLAKVNAAQVQPGDSVLFLGGGTFSGTLDGVGGTAISPVTYSSYGTGRATINAGAGNGFSASLATGIVVSNLNFEGSGWSTNAGSGIYLYEDGGVTINSCDIGGFNADSISIGAASVGSTGVNVTNCTIHDGGHTGIQVWGNYDSTGNGTTYTNSNIYIGYCTVWNIFGRTNGEQWTGSGIVLWDVSHATVERCVVHDNGINCNNNSGPCGIWCFQARGVTFQYNEAYHNLSGNNIDGDGLDFDGGTADCVMQYNYSHENVGAGMLVYEYSGARPAYNNIFRYNICQNNATNGSFAEILAGGGQTNVSIYNNTLYSKNNDCAKLSGLGSGSSFRNNLLITVNGVQLLSGYGSAVLQGNAYWSSGASENINGYSSLAAFRTASGQEMLNGQPTGTDANPMVNAPGTSGTLGNANLLDTITQYQLQSTSPLINAGLDIQSLFGIITGAQDFYGIPTPEYGGYTIGASEYANPRVTLIGSTPLFIEASNTPYSDPGATAVDGLGNVLTPAIASDSVVPSQSGTYAVIWTATNQAGYSGTATRVVVIVAAAPPTITVPSPISVFATLAGGAVVSYTTSALDVLGNVIPTQNNPLSGSLFPRGVTTVTATATDAAGQQASKTFTVTVSMPPIQAGETAAPLFTMSGSNMNMTVNSSVPGRIYQVQFSYDLSADSWQNLGSPYYGNGAGLLISIPFNNAAPSCFYRLELQ